MRGDIDHIHNATMNIANFSEEIHSLRRKLEDVDRDIRHIESQISSAQQELSRQDRDAEDKKRKVRELAAEGGASSSTHVYQPMPQQSLNRKASGSVQSEST